MAEVVNLRRARKERARAEAASKADANRVAFGRTKAEKSLTAAELELVARRIAGHKLVTPDDERS